ncbi:hypothetical protein E2C01_097876 [Portunus trituberculatus]|uniref:Uncharacterized protein n=1 Tax=Portunus trituberculatus TaxID=210409 RepID=A0A5B7K5I3_PORTR|nr:hypothetical protein [Portunus trituberculatus]
MTIEQLSIKTKSVVPRTPTDVNQTKPQSRVSHSPLLLLTYSAMTEGCTVSNTLKEVPLLMVQASPVR